MRRLSRRSSKVTRLRSRIHTPSRKTESDPQCDVERVSIGPNVAQPNLAADLAPLLDAARQARNELFGEGPTVTRDALAARLRANGHPIRTTRVAELLAALKSESAQANGRRAVESDQPRQCNPCLRVSGPGGCRRITMRVPGSVTPAVPRRGADQRTAGLWYLP